MIDEKTGEVVELLRTLIRNRCVNDGTSGSETSTAEVLHSVLDHPGIDIEQFEPFPGRASVVAKIEGTEREAPSLALLTHIDVVPASEEGWEHDPFAADVEDGFVWGRGAVDICNLTSSMAVALRRLVSEKFRPRGDLTMIASADEEAGGERGAGWLVAHCPDLVMADYVITETGGKPLPSPGGIRLGATVLEKGMIWCKIKVHGTPGHGSLPYAADNALMKATEVVARIGAIQTAARVEPAWKTYVREMELPELAEATAVDAALLKLDEVYEARQVHACTHTTFTPTVVHGGDKTNIIPDLVEIQVDVRTMPGEGVDHVRAVILDALGTLADGVELSFFHAQEATSSSTDTPLWEALGEVASSLVPGAKIVPTVTPGCSDARFWRQSSVPVYGFGLFSDAVSLGDYYSMFHGRNERIDFESLRLSTELWEGIARRFCG